MTRTFLRRGAAVGAALVVVAGCSFAGPVSRASPTCDLGESLNALVLEAQSVPTAQRVPCVTVLPAGWRIQASRAESGKAEFVLGNDRAGLKALTVRLERRCDTRGATQITSDQPGAARFERIQSVTPGFSSFRYYVFPGGCITYRFQLAPAGRALVNEASVAVSSTTRAALDAEIQRTTDGNDHL